MQLGKKILGITFFLGLGIAFSGSLALARESKIPDAAFKTTQVDRNDAKSFVLKLERRHYLNPDLNTLDVGAFIESYIARWDVERALFTQAEVDAFKQRFGPNIIEQLRKEGDMEMAYMIFVEYRKHLRSRLQWIQSQLEGGKISLESDMTFNPDRKDTPWPADTQEANAIWTKILQSSLIGEMVNLIDENEKINKEELNKPTRQHKGKTQVQLLQEAKANVQKRYQRLLSNIEQTEPFFVAEVFLSSISKSYDPHSAYMSKQTMDNFRIAMEKSLVGIGATIQEKDGRHKIVNLVPGSPAQGSSLRPGDVIVGVAQGDTGEFIDTVGMTLNKVVSFIRGDRNTVVRLRVQRADGSGKEDIRIVRDKIELASRLAKASLYQIPAGKRTIPIGVINLPNFYGFGAFRKASRDVNELLLKLEKHKVEGIVLDLRTNGGGLLREAVAIVGLFIPTGTAIFVRDGDNKVVFHEDRNNYVAWRGPLIVLTSRYSASASEITAGALQNYGRAVVIGDSTTHGKGTVQSIMPPDGKMSGSFKLTIQKFYLPNGLSTQVEGVDSDIVLPSHREYLPIGESDLPNALAHDVIRSPWKKPSVQPGQFTYVDKELLQRLSSSSKDRQEELDEFKYLRQNVDRFRERSKQKEMSLSLKKRLDEYRSNRNFIKKLETSWKALENIKLSSEEVLLEATKKQKAKAKGNQALTEEKEESPALDVHLREALRVTAEWAQLNAQKQQKPLGNP